MRHRMCCGSSTAAVCWYPSVACSCPAGAQRRGVAQVIDDPASSRLLLGLQYMAGGCLVTRRAIDEATVPRMHPDMARHHFLSICAVR